MPDAKAGQLDQHADSVALLVQSELEQPLHDAVVLVLPVVLVLAVPAALEGQDDEQTGGSIVIRQLQHGELPQSVPAHADQQAGAHKAGPHLPAITLGKDIDKIVAGIEPLLPQRSEVQRIDEDQAGVGPQG